MALTRILFLVTALALITTNDAATPVTDPKQRTEPLWMLFARHPGKSEREGVGYPKQDAAVSGFDNDKVKDVDGNYHEGSEALALPYNGVLQLARIYGGPIQGTNHKGAGAVLQAIFTKMARPNGINWANKPVGAKAMFKQLKKLFARNKQYKFRFETSDLRRASLEAIALRKSFEDANLGGSRLKESKFVVLHSMGEIGRLGEWGDRSKRSTSVSTDTGHHSDYPDRRNFWVYLKKGLPGGYRDAPANAMRMQNVKDHVLTQMRVLKPRLRTLFSFPDKDDTRHPVPKHYATATGTESETTGAQLLKDWKDGIDLVIATGHGNWYKSLTTAKVVVPVARRNVWGFANGRTVANKVKKTLDFTEFVLLKWEIKESGNLRITDGYAPGYRWYDLESVAQGLGVSLARSVDYGEFGASDDDAGYNGFQDYGYDDAEYYGFDDYDYDDDDALDEYDGEMNEYSIYEEAMKNLMRAKREFTAAKRLVMEDRRMRRKYIYN